MTDNPTANDIALLREALKLATDALANYAEPTGYTDRHGDPYTADDNPHPGLLTKRTLEQIAALAPCRHDGAAGEVLVDSARYTSSVVDSETPFGYTQTSSKPSTEQARAEALPCKFCGNDPISEDRGSPEERWVIACHAGEQFTSRIYARGAEECTEMPEVYAETEAGAIAIWNGTAATPSGADALGDRL